MIVVENEMGTLSIDPQVIKFFVTRYTAKSISNELLDFNVLEKEKGLFYFYFKYAKNNQNIVLSKIQTFTNKLKKFIFDRFGIEHNVVIVELGY